MTDITAVGESLIDLTQSGVNELGIPVALGIPVKNPVNIRQNNESIRIPKGSCSGPQGVIVADLDLIHTDTVIFIDNRNCAKIK